jgi:hypothetical protein
MLDKIIAVDQIVAKWGLGYCFKWSSLRNISDSSYNI